MAFEVDPREAVLTALTEAMSFATKAELAGLLRGPDDVISLAQRGCVEGPIGVSPLFTLCVVFVSENPDVLARMAGPAES
jgi:hypothetical protein